MEVKVGDEMYTREGFNNYPVSGGKVEKITPSGQIVLSGGMKLNASGKLMGTRQYKCYEVMTDDVRTEITTVRVRLLALEVIIGIKWRDLPTDALKAVVRIIQDHKETGHVPIKESMQ